MRIQPPARNTRAPRPRTIGIAALVIGGFVAASALLIAPDPSPTGPLIQYEPPAHVQLAAYPSTPTPQPDPVSQSADADLVATARLIVGVAQRRPDLVPQIVSVTTATTTDGLTYSLIRLDIEPTSDYNNATADTWDDDQLDAAVTICNAATRPLTMSNGYPTSYIAVTAPESDGALAVRNGSNENCHRP